MAGLARVVAELARVVAEFVRVHARVQTVTLYLRILAKWATEAQCDRVASDRVNDLAVISHRFPDLILRSVVQVDGQVRTQR